MEKKKPYKPGKRNHKQGAKESMVSEKVIYFSGKDFHFRTQRPVPVFIAQEDRAGLSSASNSHKAHENQQAAPNTAKRFNTHHKKQMQKKSVRRNFSTGTVVITSNTVLREKIAELIQEAKTTLQLLA